MPSSPPEETVRKIWKDEQPNLLKHEQA